MWRSLIILVIGVAAGGAAHFGYFNAYTPACSPLALECEMEWLRGELDLSEEQYARILQVHDQRTAEIRSLSKRVRELELLLAELESDRVREGYVDFLQIRDYLEVKRKLDEACEKSTSDLIVSVGSFMDLEQRKRYFSIVGNRTALN